MACNPGSRCEGVLFGWSLGRSGVFTENPDEIGCNVGCCWLDVSGEASKRGIPNS